MVSKSDLKKPLDSLSKLRKEEVLKYKKGEEEEKIAVFGQDSEDKAIPWVQKEVVEQDKKEREYFILMTAVLENKKKSRRIYNKFLAEIFLHFARYEQIPRKYAINLETNNIGLVAGIRGTNYYGAFATCGLPSYDFRAAQALAIRLGNTVDKLEGRFHKSEGGVILPDGEDLKVYG